MTTAKGIRIVVTQEDIERGLPGSRCWCPVARAIKRTLYGKPGDTQIPDARVTVSNVIVDIDGGHAVLPFSVIEWIENFDKGCDVKPISFDLS